jgi:hypothetical protein
MARLCLDFRTCPPESNLAMGNPPVQSGTSSNYNLITVSKSPFLQYSMYSAHLQHIPSQSDSVARFWTLCFAFLTCCQRAQNQYAAIPVTPQDLHVVVVDFGLAQMSSSSADPRFWVPALVGKVHPRNPRNWTVKHCESPKNQPFGPLGSFKASEQIWVYSGATLRLGGFGYEASNLLGS